MSYPGRSHERVSTSVLIQQSLRSVEKGLSWEVSRGHSTSQWLGRTEQFVVFKYTKIMLVINQNVMKGK